MYGSVEIKKMYSLTNNSRFEVYENGSGDVFSRAGFAEKRVKTVVSAAHRLVGWHLSVRLDSMLQTVKFPARVSDLNSSLTYVYGYTFTLEKKRIILIQYNIILNILII